MPRISVKQRREGNRRRQATWRAAEKVRREDYLKLKALEWARLIRAAKEKDVERLVLSFVTDRDGKTILGRFENSELTNV